MRSGRSNASALGQRRVYKARPWWIALAAAGVLTAAAALALWHMRQDAVDVESRELGLLTAALSDEIDRGLQGAEEGFKAMRAELSDGRLPLGGPEAAKALHTRADLMPLVSMLWLIDTEGRTLSASDAVQPPGLTSFQPSLASLADQNAALSKPFTDAAGHESSVALGVRFSGPRDGSGGWILGAVPAAAFLGAFTSVLPTSDARVGVFRSDGARLAGTIVPPPGLDEVSVAERLSELRGVEVRRSQDGVERLVASHALPRWGIVVLITRNLDAVLMRWRQTAWLTAFGITLLALIAAASLAIVQRTNWRRMEAQHALEAQSARASKLEALGTLAGGVAHDFNNVLAAIVGYAEMAQDAAPKDSDLARHLDKTLQAAMRGKTMVERILSFSRGGAHASMVFVLEPVVEEVLTLLVASLPPGVVLERRYEAPGAKVCGDPAQVFEAVMNLCNNALQAMPDGGVLSVVMARERVGTSRVLSHSRVNPGSYVVLTVADQGTGIAPEFMDRLFEPFFTTREGTGTGLGLAVVHGVVAELGGGIDVQSALGHGARFTLFLPESVADVSAQEGYTGDTPGGSGRALMVVDDDPGLVSLTVEMLKGLGYEPVGCTDPGTALARLLAEPQRYVAVIADEVMPRMSGTQLAKSLRRHSLQMPVLLVTGYGGALLASRATMAGVTRVLTKPVQRVELAQALAELLH